MDREDMAKEGEGETGWGAYREEVGAFAWA